MENMANIGGRHYSFLELLDAADGSGQYVVCADCAGVRYVCPAGVWRASAVADISPVNRGSSAREKIDLFLDLFRGREDVYARRWCSPKTGKSGYAPVCRNEWREGICDKKAHKCPRMPEPGICTADPGDHPGTPRGAGRALPGCGGNLPHAAGRHHAAPGNGF